MRARVYVCVHVHIHMYIYVYIDVKVCATRARVVHSYTRAFVYMCVYNDLEFDYFIECIYGAESPLCIVLDG